MMGIDILTGKFDKVEEEKDGWTVNYMFENCDPNLTLYQKLKDTYFYKRETLVCSNIPWLRWRWLFKCKGRETYCVICTRCPGFK